MYVTVAYCYYGGHSLYYSYYYENINRSNVECYLPLEGYPGVLNIVRVCVYACMYVCIVSDAYLCTLRDKEFLALLYNILLLFF